MSDIQKRVLMETQRWLDTPYQHQASECGSGCDCLGLIRGVYRHLYGHEPVNLPPYTPDWAELSESETLRDAARQWLEEIPNSLAKPGDALLFRMSPDAPCKHVAILSAQNIITHAYWGRAVVESFFVPYWHRRWVYSFRFPEKERSR